MKIESFLNADIYTKKIQDELNPPKEYPNFAGAWYYKVVSAKDNWIGMEATITLPVFKEDEKRYEYFDSPYGEFKRYLDTPSVYLGGSSDFETDIGFGFFRGLINGEISDEKITFRPFWRSIFMEGNEEKNEYKGTPINETEYYYYPGDKVKIHLVSENPDHLSLRIELIEATSIPKYSKIRSLNKGNKVLIINDIKAPGNGIRPSEYKRVNAIDQYHNEGMPTQKTDAYVDKCIWENVYLYRVIEQKLFKVAFNKKRMKKIYSPSIAAFDVIVNEGKEVVSIKP